MHAYRLQPARVVEQLREAGLAAGATLVPDPDQSEKVVQAFIAARRTS